MICLFFFLSFYRFHRLDRFDSFVAGVLAFSPMIPASLQLVLLAAMVGRWSENVCPVLLPFLPAGGAPVAGRLEAIAGRIFPAVKLIVGIFGWL